MKQNGFTLVEIMVVVAIIGVLLAVAIPSFVKARHDTQRDLCINNLRQIDSAKARWAMEAGAKSGDPCDAADIESYIHRDLLPDCPAGHVPYIINVIAKQPECQSGIVGHAL